MPTTRTKVQRSVVLVVVATIALAHVITNGITPKDITSQPAINIGLSLPITQTTDPTLVVQTGGVSPATIRKPILPRRSISYAFF